MATNPVTPFLTIEEFIRLYGAEKPAYEYWDGLAVQKPTPTILHSFLQFVLQSLLKRRGLAAAGEVRIKLHSTREPAPDVIAGPRLQSPYRHGPYRSSLKFCPRKTASKGCGENADSMPSKAFPASMSSIPRTGRRTVGILRPTP